MQGDFVVYPQQLNGDSAEYTGIYQRIDSLAAQLERIKNKLSVDSYGNVKSTLSTIESSLRQESLGIRHMQTTLRQCVSGYSGAESKITGEKVSHTPTNTPTQTVRQPTEEETWTWTKDDWLKYLWKFMGSDGCLTAAAAPWLKIFLSNMTGEEIDAKTIGNLMKTTAFNNFEFFTTVADKGWKEAIKSATGLSYYLEPGAVSTSDSFSAVLAKSFAKEKNAYTDFSKLSKGAKAVSKWAGVALTGIFNGVENYDEWDGGNGISAGRAITETVIETAVDVGTGAVASAVVGGVFTSIAVAAGAAGAPVLLVAAASAGVVVGANWLVKKITGEDIGENIANVICDAGEAIGNTACKVGDAIASWFR